jgi:hypothetical protein
MCPEHGQVSPDKPVASLRIFLSYGHNSNEELVRRIKTDLEKRGHDVWFDKSEIKFGVDWRREITDGIVGSNRILSFLSKYSTRDPGVCRDEIAIALGVKGGNIQSDSFGPERRLQKYEGFSMSYQCCKYKDEIEFIELCHYNEYSITVRKHGSDNYSIERVYPSH